MNCSVSNIAWSWENDGEMYEFLQEKGFSALEIAPTRVFPENPYKHRNEGKIWAKNLKNDYGLSISSLQSIWFGREEGVFSGKEERERLYDYTCEALAFAVELGCGNVVFGCPKQRNNPNGESLDVFYEFLSRCGDYAHKIGTVFALEANPSIYGTNVVNRTAEAFSVVEELGNPGLAVNLDLGTMLVENEDLEILRNREHFINHVHISEANLDKIQVRGEHIALKVALEAMNYEKYVSIEMKKTEVLSEVKDVVSYIGDLYGATST